MQHAVRPGAKPCPAAAHQVPHPSAPATFMDVVAVAFKEACGGLPTKNPRSSLWAMTCLHACGATDSAILRRCDEEAGRASWRAGVMRQAGAAPTAADPPHHCIRVGFQQLGQRADGMGVRQHNGIQPSGGRAAAAGSQRPTDGPHQGGRVAPKQQCVWLAGIHQHPVVHLRLVSWWGLFCVGDSGDVAVATAPDCVLKQPLGGEALGALPRLPPRPPARTWRRPNSQPSRRSTRTSAVCSSQPSRRCRHSSRPLPCAASLNVQAVDLHWE